MEHTSKQVTEKRGRRSRLKKDIEELRELAFGAPDDSPFPQAVYDEIERDSIVRARVLLDCALVEELARISHGKENRAAFAETSS